jgi:hypothetical protein
MTELARQPFRARYCHRAARMHNIERKIYIAHFNRLAGSYCERPLAKAERPAVAQRDGNKGKRLLPGLGGCDDGLNV